MRSAPGTDFHAVHALNLSEANAYTYSRIARKAIFVPELKDEIEAGKLTISNAKQILREHPEHEKKESVRQVSEDQVSLKVVISEELLKELRRAQAVLSGNERRVVSLEETLSASVKVFLEKKDPVEKAERARQVSDPGKNARSAGGVVEVGKRRPIPAHIRHAVYRRDHGCCTYISPDGRQCTSFYFVELHHRRPVSEGGANSVENIVTLCHRHHSYHHQVDVTKIKTPEYYYPHPK